MFQFKELNLSLKASSPGNCFKGSITLFTVEFYLMTFCLNVKFLFVILHEGESAVGESERFESQGGDLFGDPKFIQTWSI